MTNIHSRLITFHSLIGLLLCLLSRAAFALKHQLLSEEHQISGNGDDVVEER